MKLFDSHAHPHLSAFAGETEAVIGRGLAEGIGMLIVGTHLETSRRGVATAEHFPGTWAAIGLHPIHVSAGYFDPNEESLLPGAARPGFKRRAEGYEVTAYRELALSSPKVVAIGEVGLDYYRLQGIEDEQELTKQLQREVLSQQLRLAGELGLPVAIHCREAHGDVAAAIARAQAIYPALTGVIHCFTGTPEEGQKHLALGFLISFSGIITFASEWDDFIRATPLDKLLVETDCPYLTPVPHRGKRNEPAFVAHTARRLADLKGVSFETAAAATTENARELFGLS